MIPKLEPTLNVRHSRFRDAPFFINASKAEVFVGGAGGIGSYLIPLLSRIVHTINFMDFDAVEKVNLAGQNFTELHVGMSKVMAVQMISKQFGTAMLHPWNDKVTEGTDVPEKIVFSAFDNMTARKDLFSIWKENENRELFVDARLLADQYEVFFVEKGQEDKYEAALFTDDEVETVSCTFKQTSHFAAMCAARMVHGMTNYFSKEMLYDMPFHIREEGNLFFTEITSYDKF